MICGVNRHRLPIRITTHIFWPDVVILYFPCFVRKVSLCFWQLIIVGRTVVDEDIYRCYLHVEVVVVLDGEVPHPARRQLGCVAAGDADDGASGCAEAVAVAEGYGPGPLPGGLVEEQVRAGGVDDARAVRSLYLQVIQVGVMVEQDGGNRLGLGLAGPGAGGQDLVAGFELADGDGGAGGEQDLGAGGEALPAAGDARFCRVD
jgi:hypothetical protein